MGHILLVKSRDIYRKKSKKIIFNRRLQEKNKQKKMTLVIAAKFRDGVVLVADRKITDPNSDKEQWIRKLKEPYPDSPICFGAAGYKNKFDQFNRKILITAAEHMRETDFRNKALFIQNNLEYPESEKDEGKTLNKEEIESKMEVKEKNVELTEIYNYTMEHFLEDSQELIRKLCTGYDDTIRSLLEVLTVLHSEEKARIHHLEFDGGEEEVEYCAIGSGADYVNLFLEKFWNEKMSIDEVLKLAYFCIYYVQDLKFDKGVGVEEGILPDDFVILDDGRFGYFNGFKDKESQTISEIRGKVKQFKNTIDNLSF